MPVNLRAASPPDEIFPDSFRARAFDLQPLDPAVVSAPLRAFEPAVFSLAMRPAYVNVGLVGPLELILASPAGRHEQRELPDVPLAVIVYPDSGGRWTLTLREVAHNGWWAQVIFSVEGDPS